MADSRRGLKEGVCAAGLVYVCGGATGLALAVAVAPGMRFTGGYGIPVQPGRSVRVSTASTAPVRRHGWSMRVGTALCVGAWVVFARPARRRLLQRPLSLRSGRRHVDGALRLRLRPLPTWGAGLRGDARRDALRLWNLTR